MLFKSKENHSNVVVVLDRSGSMHDLWDETLNGLEEFLNEQKAIEGTADLTLVVFDYEYTVVFAHEPLDEINSIRSRIAAAGIRPRGATALLEAIERTIDAEGLYLAGLDESEIPENGTQIVILTDGHENASHPNYTSETVGAKIKHQREQYDWDFLFLGANQDAILTASTLNIPSSFAATYDATGDGVDSALKSVSSYLIGTRTVGSKAMRGTTEWKNGVV